MAIFPSLGAALTFPGIAGMAQDGSYEISVPKTQSLMPHAGALLRT